MGHPNRTEPTAINGLPNPARVGAHHGLARLAAPGFLELRHVLDYAVHAEIAGGVLIVDGQEPRHLVGLVLAPDLSPADEYALLRRKAIDRPGRLARVSQRLHQRHVSDAQAAVVRSVFTERKLAAHVNVIHRDELVILINQALSTLFEGLFIFRRPPVLEIAFGVEERPLIVKSMSEFVANHRTHTAEIQRIISLEIIEWRLEDASREVDVIFRGFVKGISRGGGN